jgi:dihydropteroate synthase
MFTLNCKGRLLVVDKPLIMGIINLTPDSFYAGSRFDKTDDVLYRVEIMLKEGADIIDIGAQSTRPGSERITGGDELKRLMPSLEAIVKRFPDAVISIDTYMAEVAKAAVQAGAGIINDVSGGTMDSEIIQIAATFKVPYVLSHIQGEPGTMQKKPAYNNVVVEILDYFIFRTATLKKAGIHDIIIDPGFGFGKTIEHNFQILKDLSLFRITGFPILCGLSRKSTVYKTLGISAEESLNGTTVLNTIALLNAANLLRVHDVREARETLTLYQRYSEVNHAAEMISSY